MTRRGRQTKRSELRQAERQAVADRIGQGIASLGVGKAPPNAPATPPRGIQAAESNPPPGSGGIRREQELARRLADTEDDLDRVTVERDRLIVDVRGLREMVSNPVEWPVREGPMSELQITVGQWLSYVETGDEAFIANMRPDGMRAVLRQWGDTRRHNIVFYPRSPW